ncbi:CDGSH-type Zn-finger protein/truncated hemoglobin YjbI/ferredoxin [Catenulispora sp. MAP5-51]|uniref:CDGSH iron-sulfur domain-containing protein n=1 Tax=Catenulispora sp. MAP5-51 TaxID=3156298 RepID=UPI003517A3FD
MTTGNDAATASLPALLAGVRRVGHRIPDDLSSLLAESVIRPLVQLVGPDAAGTAAEASDGDEPSVDVDVDADGELWRLTQEATRLRTTTEVSADASPLLIEATAALQNITCELASDPTEVAARIALLTELQSGLPTSIQAAPDGPYLVTNAPELTTWLGEPIPVRPQMALCRCGDSATKPFCDGAHAKNGFTGAKSPERVADQQDSYPGQQITVLDNRGICAHSGLCTDRLPTVFRQGREPFVAPSGGRMDEIVRAVRDCPSGALSVAIDGREARDQVDQVDQESRPPAIEVSKDGPYRVTGSIPLTGPDGEPEPRAAGASTEHYSLCRCGQSQNKPFCSGMHWYTDFRDPPPPAEPTLFQWAGGLPALTRMTRIFYTKYVPEDPLLAPIFATMSPDHPERVAAWLGETFGGPTRYTDAYGGYDRMVSQHANRSLTEEQRARWAQLIIRSADDAGLPRDPEFRAAFVSYIEWGSRIAVENSQPGAQPPPHMPVPRWWWVCGATPDARVSALAVQPDPEGPVVTLPADDQPISFEAHIRTLFREMDRRSMKFVFDLWSHDDVSRHAEAILGRLRQGSMPCDGAWPAEKTDVFERWIQAGKPA